MSIASRRPVRLPALTLTLALTSITTVHAEDHWTLYDSGTSPPADRRSAEVPQTPAVVARNAGDPATRNDASVGKPDTLGADGRLDEVYREMFQPGSPWWSAK